jgi:hypothetical protein
MMGDLDVKAALRRFFNESREVLNVAKANLDSLLNNKNKRKLLMEDSNQASPVPAAKKKKRYDSLFDWSHQPGEFTFLPNFVQFSPFLRSSACIPDQGPDRSRCQRCSSRSLHLIGHASA